MNKQIKLNLGCGKDYKIGWINVDISKECKVDILADLSKEFPFKDNYADEILLSDILEHFTKEDGIVFLKECYRVLKIDGTITIRTHNIFQIIDQFQNDPEVLIHFLYGNTKEDGVFGAHKFAYTNELIKHTLIKIGFENISIKRETTNFLIIAKKSKNTDHKIKIGIIMQSPDIGGAEIYMLSLINYFLHQKNSVIVVSNKEKFLAKAKKLTSQTYVIPMILDIIGNYRGLIKSILLLPYAVSYYSNLLQKFKKEKVSVILMSNFSEKLLVTLLSTFYKIPVVWIEYGRLETVFKKNFYIPKIIYRLLKDIPYAIIVPSKNTMDSLIVDARTSLAKLSLVPLGIPVNLKKRSKPNPILSNLKNKIIIGNVSRLTQEKGQEFLIKAMPIVLKEVPNAYLFVIGDGPDKGNYDQLVTKLHLENSVKITGFVNDIDQYFECMDIFVFPTIWKLEGFGLVLPEAMSYRLPVVATNVGPVPEIVDDEKTGILVNPHDERELAQAIITLAKDPEKRKIFGEYGYAKMKQKYIIEKSASQITEILYEATIKV